MYTATKITFAWKYIWDLCISPQIQNPKDNKNNSQKYISLEKEAL